MAFNRYADWEIDQRNPRTEGRHRLVSRAGAVTLIIGSAIAFVATTLFINRLCFLLSPVALLIVFFYILPVVVPDAEMVGLFGGLILAIVIILWWLFFSRAAWVERLGALLVMAVALAAISPVVHPSISNGMMGLFTMSNGVL